MKVELEKELLQKAKAKKRRVVFPEASFSSRIVQAGIQIAKQGIADVVFLADENFVCQNHKNIFVVNYKTSPLLNELANKIHECQKHKNVTLEQAKQLCNNPIYFANAYVACGYADAIVCGAEVSTAQTLKPALQIIKSEQGLVSSYFLFCGKNPVTDDAFLMGDCAVVEEPTSEQLCIIATNMIKQFNMLGLKNPKVAFLSYSTLGSANSPSTQNVANAHKLFKQQCPNVQSVGEVQLDASINKNVAKVKMPNQQFTPPANIFVMPNLNAGNICYKAVQYFGGLKAIGPITTGFTKPVNDLSRGCTIKDIVLLTAITCIQCK